MKAIYYTPPARNVDGASMMPDCIISDPIFRQSDGRSLHQTANPVVPSKRVDPDLTQ